MNSGQDKKPEDPFAGIGGYLKGAFERARAQVGDSLETLGNEARDTLKIGEKAAGKALDQIQETVGKDRIIGAVIGAKAGGTIGLAGGVPGMVKGGIVGAAVGFVGGRKFLEWYNRNEKNDNDPDGPSNPSP